MTVRKLKIDCDEITFSSGRTAYAHLGIVGINPQLKLYNGYDGTINWPVPDFWSAEEKAGKLTADDMRELADHMIELWTAFKHTL